LHDFRKAGFRLRLRAGPAAPNRLWDFSRFQWIDSQSIADSNRVEPAKGRTTPTDCQIRCETGSNLRVKVQAEIFASACVFATSVAALNCLPLADKIEIGQEAGIRTRAVRFTGGDAAVTPQS
jgi:hypothetical protein